VIKFREIPKIEARVVDGPDVVKGVSDGGNPFHYIPIRLLAQRLRENILELMS
jgi:hypothetical protein